MSEDLISQIIENVLQGRRNKNDEGLDDDLTGQPGVVELVEEGLQQGVDVEKILVDGLSHGMNLVGEKYEKGEYFIPDMLAAAEAVGEAMEVLEPHLASGEGARESKAKVVMATVEKDQHDIGKNLVCIMLRGAGFSVVDMGVNVPAPRIIETMKEENAQILGLSALLDTTMPFMAQTIEELEKEGIRDKVKVMIGGAPTSEEFAREIGADAHGKDAFAAVKIAEKMTTEGGR